MKRFYKLFTLAALVLWAGCTNETEVTVPEPTPEPVTPITEREVMLELQNDLKLSSIATRAIATTEENEISSLDVYVFGALEEDGNYTYQERFSYRANGTVVPGSTAITLDATGQPTALLRPKKGLFVKFYCVANQPDLYELDNITDPGAPEYKLYDTFNPLVQSAPGQDNNTVVEGVPTEDKFKELVTRVINPKVKNDTIVPALPMSGAYATTLDLKDFSLISRLQIGIKLTRVVARFDVQNNPETTKLTIDSIAMDNGRPTTTMFPVEAKGTAANPGNGLITYPGRHYWGADVAGLRKSAFYTYSSPRNDNGALVLIGKYAINKTETVDVRYRVPFTQVKDGTGAYVEINHNHRYTVEVTEANEHEIKVNITVNDWADSGNIDDYTPENGMDDLTITPASADKCTYDADTKTITMSVAAATLGEFTVGTGANASIDCQATYAEKDAEWLVIEKETPTPSTRAWTMPATFTVKVKESYSGKYPKATLRFVNTASSEARIIYVVPEAAPLIDIAASAPGTGDSNPNEITGDPSNPTVSLYNLTNDKSTFDLAVSCPDGVAVDETNPIPDWLSVTPKELTSANGTIKITVISTELPTPLPNYTLKIKNKSNGSLAVEVPVTIKDATPEVTNFSASDNTGWIAPDPANDTAGQLAIIDGNTMTVSGIQTFNGAKIDVSYGGVGGDWLVAGTPVAEVTTRASAGKKEKVVFTLKEGVAVTGEATVEITDKTLDTPALTFKVKPILSAPTVAVGTAVASPTQNSYNAVNKVLSMYRLPSATSTLSFKATALGGSIVELPSFTGLTVAPTGGENVKEREYTLSLTQGTVVSNGLSVNVKNNSDNTKITALTLNILDPKITKVEKDASSTTGELTDVMNGDALTFTMTKDKTFVLKVSSPAGVTSKLSSTAWCKVSDGAFANGSQLVTITCTATTGKDDITLTLTNKIAGGGDKVIKITPRSGIPEPIVEGNTVWEVNGYWVTAPSSNVSQTYQWNSNTSATSMASDPCAGHGSWRMPTMEDFEKMAGWTATWPWSQSATSTTKDILSDKSAWNTAFPSGYYWSSVARTSDSHAWGMYSNGNGTADYNWYVKTNSRYVRCVQVK